MVLTVLFGGICVALGLVQTMFSNFLYKLYGYSYNPFVSDKRTIEEIDAMIDEGNALITSWPTVAEAKAKIQAEEIKHL